MNAKFSSSCLLHTTWDNIDSKKAKNNPHCIGDILDFHGTIVTDSQSNKSVIPAADE